MVHREKALFHALEHSHDLTDFLLDDLYDILNKAALKNPEVKDKKVRLKALEKELRSLEKTYQVSEDSFLEAAYQEDPYVHYDPDGSSHQYKG